MLMIFVCEHLSTVFMLIVFLFPVLILSVVFTTIEPSNLPVDTH